jgi:hypothetical protein
MAADVPFPDTLLLHLCTIDAATTAYDIHRFLR